MGVLPKQSGSAARRWSVRVFVAAALATLSFPVSALGEAVTQTYCGRRFDDKNGDSIQQADEPPHANIRVGVTDSSGSERFAVTGPNGEFCVLSIPIGTYVVRFSDRPTATTRIVVSTSGVLTLPAESTGDVAPVVTASPAVPSTAVSARPTTTMKVNPNLPLGVPYDRAERATTTRPPTVTRTDPPTSVRPPTTAPRGPASSVPTALALAPATSTTRPTRSARLPSVTLPSTPRTTTGRVAETVASTEVKAPGHQPLSETGSSNAATSVVALGVVCLGLTMLLVEARRYRPRHFKQR